MNTFPCKDCGAENACWTHNGVIWCELCAAHADTRRHHGEEVMETRRCHRCNRWKNECHEVAKGLWTCNRCVTHLRQDYTERDRIERRVREKFKEERDMNTINMTERERVVRERYGFTEADMLDPLRSSMVHNLARTEQRMADAERQEGLENEIAAVGRQLGLDPKVYIDRCQIFTELARRNHPLAAERYGRP